MKLIKKTCAIALLGISLLSMSVPVYAHGEVNEISTARAHVGEIPYSPQKSIPTCPSCRTNKWVVPHGLVTYACMKCGKYFNA